MADTRRLSELVRSVAERTELPDGILVLGLSGGADSAALGFVCTHLGRQFRAIHVDHGLVGSSSLRGAAVRIADALDVELNVVETEVGEGPSLEGKARAARYTAFASETGEDETLLTAHTRDDHVETVVFNMIRGTGPRGLAGIPRERPPNVYRPLLDATRSETREIAALAGLPFVEDPMNLDHAFTRTVIRTEIIPALTALNPRLADSVVRMSRAVGADNDYLDEAASRVPIARSGRSFEVAAADVAASPRPIADRVLKSLLSEALGSAEVSNRRVEEVRAVSEGRVRRVELTAGFVAHRDGAMLRVSQESDEHEDGFMELSPGRHAHRNLVFDVVRSDSVCRVAPLSRWAALFPASVRLDVGADGVVLADGEPAWQPGSRRYPVSWYQPGTVGYLSVFAREEA